MLKFIEIVANLIIGVGFAFMIFLWSFEPKDFWQYSGIVIAIGVVFTMGKLDNDRIQKLEDEVDQLKRKIKEQHEQNV